MPNSPCDVDSYYVGVNWTSSQQLAHDLRFLLRRNVVEEPVPEVPTTDVLAEVDGNETTVLGFFSGSGIPKEQFSETRPGLERYDVWDVDRVWRMPSNNLTSSAFRDLHNLRPVRGDLMDLRGNHSYGECFYVLGKCTSWGTGNDGPFAIYANEDKHVWAPDVKQQGKVARAALYMALRYGKDWTGVESFPSDSTFLRLGACNSRDDCTPMLDWSVLQDKNTIEAWSDNPVEDDERARNNRICAEYQGNRNPFVDFPEHTKAIIGAMDMVIDATTPSIVDPSLSFTLAPNRGSVTTTQSPKPQTSPETGSEMGNNQVVMGLVTGIAVVLVAVALVAYIAVRQQRNMAAIDEQKSEFVSDNPLPVAPVLDEDQEEVLLEGVPFEQVVPKKKRQVDKQE